MPRKTIFKIGLATAAAAVAATMAITSAFAHGTPTTTGRSIVATIVNTAAGAAMVSNDSIASTTISDEQDQDAIEAAELAAKIAAEQAQLAAKLAAEQAEEAAEAAATTCVATDQTEDTSEKAADQSEDSAEKTNGTESASEDAAEQAARGFALEQATGIPLSSAQRNYRDNSHKPEMICALTEFHALCGFREPSVTVHLLAALEVPQLDHYLGLLSGQPDLHGTRALFSSIITIPPSTLGPLLSSVLAACVERVQAGGEFATEYRTALELGERYPGDPGVLASLLLNRITLQPGQALYLPGGNLHAYLAGVGIEIMANSDNVLRGGLTPKHVDVPELMKVLDFTPHPVPVLAGDPGRAGEWFYPTPAVEFRLSRLELGGGSLEITHDGPQVLLTGPAGPFGVGRGQRRSGMGQW